MKCGVASGFAFGYDPTGRSDYFRLIKNDRIPYFDIHHSLFDIRYSLFYLLFPPSHRLLFPTFSTSQLPIFYLFITFSPGREP